MIAKLAIPLIILDAVYLYSTSGFTGDVIARVQKSPLEMKIIPAILCYVFVISLIYYFIIKKNASIIEAFFLGVFVYGIYDTTNMATLKGWSPILVVIDTVWGGILFATSVYVYRRL